MYNFSYFKDKDKRSILEFMANNPFAMITGSSLSGNQIATQVPVLIEERDGELYIQGHIMKNADHYKAFVENPEVLIIFTGPQAYVSASWYSNPHMGSTWNYMSVHINGDMNLMSPDDLVAFMKKFTLKFEDNNPNSPTIYNNLDASYTSKMMPGIVGFEVKADSIKHVFKLSQNKDKQSYLNIIAQLKKRGATSAMVATQMEQRIAELFPE